MNTIRKINEELSIAGQITPEQLEKLVFEGYRSILNLRSSGEKGWLENERDKSEYFGLYYLHLPTKVEEINNKVVLRLLKKISEVPKPVLIHCDNSIRSAAIVLIYIATKHGVSLEKAFQQVNQLGLLQ